MIVKLYKTSLYLITCNGSKFFDRIGKFLWLHPLRGLECDDNILIHGAKFLFHVQIFTKISETPNHTELSKWKKIFLLEVAKVFFFKKRKKKHKKQNDLVEC